MKLHEWQKALLPALRSITRFPVPALNNLTLMAYFYYDDERIETEFFATECSILCAYNCCGLLPTVLVVNRTTPQINAFVKRYGAKLQVDEKLTGGVKAMNIDCDARLCERFDTEYVLNVESDGIIVNHGIEKFIGRWDYIGAPWRITNPPWYLRPFPDYLVGNSGLCLRSHKICTAASRLYTRYFSWMPYNWCLIEDIFYCKILRWLFPSFKKSFKFPSVQEAAMFSVEWAAEHLSTNPPLGFHGTAGFENYVSNFGLPLAEILPKESS